MNRLLHITLIIATLLLLAGCRCSSHKKDRQNKRTTTKERKIEREKHESDITVIGTPKPRESEFQQPYEPLSDAICALLQPKYEGTHSEQLIIRKAYIASYNKDTRCPNWVGWRLTADHANGTLGRRNDFHEDEEVPEPRATSADYKGSGWSRGHMCPAGDNKWDSQAMYETFSYINICPQNVNLNNGLWNSIENDCRNWAKRYGEVYIVCGPLYFNRQHELIGTNQVAVPEAFFKAVLRLSPEPQAFGFIVRNTDGNKKRDLYYHSIDELERITHYDFFTALPDPLENTIEATTPNPNEW